MDIPTNDLSVPVYAVIVAGGQGSRMGSALPKQFLDIKGKPVLYYCIRQFLDAIPDIHLVLVLPSHQISLAQIVLQHFPERIDLTIVSGGETRFHSVQNGLKDIPADAIVMVHDGVRPFISGALIKNCIDTAISKGSAIPAIAVQDSMRIVNVAGSAPIDRNTLRIIQTPQTFQASVLLPAFEQQYSDSFTDEATVVEACGQTVTLIAGEKNNFKITTPEDLILAEMLIQ